MKIKLEIKSEQVTKQLADLDKYVNRDLGKEAYDYFKSITPMRSGNARRKTKYSDKGNTKVIEGNYPYAQRLDTGWSKQAPKGMSEPTQDFIEREYQKEIAKLRNKR